MKYLTLFTALVFSPSLLFADHGPLTTGAGATLIEPMTLKRYTLAISTNLATNRYSSLSDADIRELTLKTSGTGGHVDAITQSVLWTTAAGFGITDAIEVGLRARYYRGEKVREGLIDSGGTYRFIDLGTIAGLADPDIYSKYRILKRGIHTLSIAGFAKIPLGKHYSLAEAQPLSTYAADLAGPNFHLVGGGNSADPLAEKYALEPSLTPGSGAWDFSAAVAYSVWLGEGVSGTASVMYTRRLVYANYKIGDSIEGGFALQKRWGSRDEANFSLFAEIAFRTWMKAETSGQTVANTGGTMLLNSVGATWAWPNGLSTSLSFQAPLAMYLNAPQQELAYRTALNIAYLLPLGNT
jgi:hypothetical protein